MTAADYQHFTAARPEAVFAALIKALTPLNGRIHSVEDFGTCVLFSLVADRPEDICRMRASVAPSGPGTLVSVANAEPDTLVRGEAQLPLKALDRLLAEVDHKLVAAYPWPGGPAGGGPVTR